MKPRYKKMMLIGSGVSILVVAGLLVLNAFRSNIVFFSSPSDIFWSPSEVVTGKAPAQQVIRVGGHIAGAPEVHGSATKTELEFTVSDKVSSLPVLFRGMVQAPLAANLAVIVRGRLQADGHFIGRDIEVAAATDNVIRR